MSNNDNLLLWAEAFKALGNEHRLRLYLALVACCGDGMVCAPAEDGSLPCVGDLGKDLDIAPSTLSHHLKELAQAGLIRMERRGRHITCSVCDDSALGKMVRQMAGQLRSGCC
ncbi:MAG: winged helix-turn-helix transcriptional regulator [Nitrospinae bacterium]|nr:winged helix-turn-helix transcriptional regulator [Nitrospinota bacterium]